jgi:hypothetical protein
MHVCTGIVGTVRTDTRSDFRTDNGQSLRTDCETPAPTNQRRLARPEGFEKGCNLRFSGIAA